MNKQTNISRLKVIYLTIDIISLSKIIGAISIIFGVVFSFFKFIENNKKQTKEIKNIKAEQMLVIYALSACLDGLHQQNCNGKVTEAINKIDKYINQAAHDELL